MSHHGDPPERPPVEALPDLSWARLERRLWQSLDAVAPEPAPRRRSWRWPAVGAGLIVVAAAAALVWPRPSTPTPGPAPAAAVDAPRPSRVATAAAATDVVFGDADIQIGPHSTLFLGGSDQRGFDLYLERGRASFEVTPRAGRPAFVVRAGSTRVTVVGTGFTVARDGDGAQVEVRHGLVEITAGAARYQVRGGEVWDGHAVRPGQLALVEDAPAGSALTPAIATAPPPAAPPPAAPLSSPAAPSTVPRAPRAAPGPALDRKAAFAAAAAQEATAPDAAQTAYLSLAAGRDAWAANALYAAARLADDRGDRATAARLARRYLTRFPTGGNVVDARALLSRAAGPAR
ncbi:MAG: FecR family protein [Kofleriaceae bacterium]